MLLLAGAGCPRLSRLALLRVLTRLDEDSKEGEEVCNCPELTGVAIKVGVTSLRVIRATVVLARSRLRGRLLGRIRVRNKLGRIAGVNEDCAGRVKVILDLEADGLTVAEDESSSSEFSPPRIFSPFTIELEANVKSSSNSLKSATLLATLSVLLLATGLPLDPAGRLLLLLPEVAREL